MWSTHLRRAPACISLIKPNRKPLTQTRWISPVKKDVVFLFFLFSKCCTAPPRNTRHRDRNPKNKKITFIKKLKEKAQQASRFCCQKAQKDKFSLLSVQLCKNPSLKLAQVRKGKPLNLLLKTNLELWGTRPVNSSTNSCLFAHSNRVN